MSIDPDLLKNMELRLIRIETRLVKYQEQNMLEAALLKESLQVIVRLSEAALSEERLSLIHI